MTDIGYVIAAGEDIPEDVTGVDDRVGDGWELRDEGWICTRYDNEYGRHSSAHASGRLSREWGPLTVSAVREQPAEPEPQRCPECGSTAIEALCRDSWHQRMRAERNHAAFIAEGCCGMVAVHMADCPKFDASELRAAVYKYAPAESVDLLELLAQLRNMLQTDAVYTVEADELFPRIEAEVNRQRAELETLRTRERSLMEARDDWMRRERAARAETERLDIAVTQEIEARDENAEWADRLANAIAAHLGVDIGEHSNANLPWQAALIALEDADAAPLVLSLPEVPPGTVALIGVETGRRWARDGNVWTRPDDGSTVRFARVLDEEFGSVRAEMAPPREPRTWPKLDAVPEIDDLPDMVEVSGWRWWRVTEMDGTGSRYNRPGELFHRTLQQLRELGEVREVLDDKDGTR